METAIRKRLETLLLQSQLLMPSEIANINPSRELDEVWNSICKLVFPGEVYRHIWDERILSHLSRLFAFKPPAINTYGNQVIEISEKAQSTKHINDFFFRILNHNTSVEEVVESIGILSIHEPSLLPHLKASDRLKEIREIDCPPSEKIITFLNYLRDDIGLDLTSNEPVKECLKNFKTNEGPGVANALLIKRNGEGALMIPFKSGVQKGDGQIHSGINSSKEFEATLQRARLALLGQGFLKSSDDIVYTLELTEAEYIGTSIGLAGAVSIYSAAKGVVIDPYAAFTGDIIPDHQEWRVRGIRGIRQKLEAARHNGCRRIFIPRENQEEMDSTAYKTLQIIPVDTLIEVFLQLQTPFQPLRGDSIQVRKINELRAFCQDQGWDLSQPQTIQHGLQFHVAPLIFPELSLNVFNTGTHTPKQHNIQEYQQLLKNLELLEKPKIPIRKVEQTLKIQNSSVQKEIMVALEQLQPTERRQEPHCEYAFKFGQEQEHLVVKQYQKGSLQFQGTAGELYKTVLECVVAPHSIVVGWNG